MYDDGYRLTYQKETTENATQNAKESTTPKEPNGFSNSISRLRGELRSKSSEFDGYLEEKIGEVLSVDWVKKDGSELADIGLPWREELGKEK